MSRLWSVVCMAALVGSIARADVCEVPDNGTGTVDLPPPGCGYVSPDDLHIMIGNLPAGTEIHVAAEHAKFFNEVRFPGGSLGGEVEQFQSFLFMQMTGTGDLAGFARTMAIPIACEVHTGPRSPGDPVQTFPNEMVQLQGQLFGDPDFDFIQIVAGSSFGLPSPGQTTLTQLPNGNFNVDSFFDIAYRIEFQGAPGSILEGFGGPTEGTVRMQGGEPAPDNPCVVADDGTGTVRLPPDGCQYLSPDQVHMIIDGLPPGTTIEFDPIHDRFFNVVATPGGTLGGEIEQFQSQLTMTLNGTGDLEGYARTMIIPIQCEVHTGPRTPGDPVQEFDNDMVRLQGKLFGDPDFEFLGITGGTEFGLPSPGHTTLTQLPSGDFQVDSFFDIAYRIDFQGAPGSILEGLGGSTVGTVRMGTGDVTPLSSPQTGVAAGTRLLAPRPNPFHPSTALPFVLENAGTAQIRIYDATGRLLRTLVDAHVSAGSHRVNWDGRDESGRLLASGTYFYELVVDGHVVETRQAVMLK